MGNGLGVVLPGHEQSTFTGMIAKLDYLAAALLGHRLQLCNRGGCQFHDMCLPGPPGTQTQDARPLRIVIIFRDWVAVVQSIFCSLQVSDYSSEIRLIHCHEPVSFRFRHSQAVTVCMACDLAQRMVRLFIVVFSYPGGGRLHLAIYPFSLGLDEG